MEEQITMVTQSLASGVALILGALIGLVVKKVLNYIKLKTDNEAIDKALDRLEQNVKVATEGLTSIANGKLKQVLADGKVTKEEMDELVKAIHDEVLLGLKQDTLDNIAMGIGDIDTYVNSLTKSILDQIANEINKEAVIK